MRILVIDDFRTFVDGVHEYTHARTVAAAIARIDSGERFDRIYLDYDLSASGRQYDNSEAFARYLATSTLTIAVDIITDSDDGAKRLETLLAGYNGDVTITDLGHRWNDAHM